MIRALVILGLCLGMGGCMTVTINNYAEENSRIVCTTTTEKPVTTTPNLQLDGESLGKMLGTAAKTAVLP